MNYDLIVQLVKEVMFEVYDENISDYNVDDLLLYCFEQLDNDEEIDVKDIVKNALRNWNLDGVV